MQVFWRSAAVRVRQVALAVGGSEILHSGYAGKLFRNGQARHFGWHRTMKRTPQGRAGAARRAFRPATLIFLVLTLWPVWSFAQGIAAPTCNAADPDQVRLQVSVTGMRSTDGNIAITIYPDDPVHFLDGAYKVARQQVPVTLPVTHACFVVGAPGFYAVALFHDDNNSGHFETNRLGLPAKGYGFSNNPTLYFGPPALSRVRFDAHRGDNTITVQLKYW